MKKRLLIFSIIIAVLFTSCAKTKVLFRFSEKGILSAGSLVLTESEVRLIALSYGSRYDKYYRSMFEGNFWETEVSEGFTFEDYVKEYAVYAEGKALLYLSLLAEEMNLSLNADQEEKAEAAAEKYFSSLNENDLQFTGATLSSVRSLMKRYLLSELVVGKLSEGKDSGISDEEARVIDVEVLHVRSEEEAETLLSRVKRGENFSLLANENTVDEKVAYSLSREDLLPEVRELLFGMQENQISKIVEIGSEYFIFRLDSAYNTILSENEKKNLTAVKKFRLWGDAYQELSEEKPIALSHVLWDGIHFSDYEGEMDADLFSYLPG